MRFTRLAFKLPVLVTVALIVGSVAGSLLLIVVGRSVLEAEALRDTVFGVQSYASAISYYMNDASSILETTAGLRDLTELPPPTPTDAGLRGLSADLDAPQRKVAAQILAHSKVFEYVQLLRTDGLVYLIEPYELQATQIRTDRTFASWYTRVMDTGRTVVSDLYISTVTKKPTIVVATPIRSSDGRIIGVWAGGLRLDELSRKGDGAPETTNPLGYGFVTDRRGLVIAHQTNPKYVREQTDFSSLPSVQSALSGQSGTARYVSPIDEDEKLAAYVPFPDAGWAIVYSESRRKALAPIDQMTGWTVLRVVIFITLLSLSIVIITRRIVRPIERLTAAAEAIGAGDFAFRIDIRTGDEIERLATAFNEMAAALALKDAQVREHAEDLEQKVRERTADLEEEIADRQRAEAEIQQLNLDLDRRVGQRTAELEAANKDLEAFNYSISHDLRGPLLAINGFSRMLMEDHASQLSPAGQRFLRLVRGNSLEMGRLIDDLLAFSQLGRRPVTVQPVDTASLVDRVLKDLTDESTGRRLDLVVHDLPQCQADLGLLKQVFVNLLSNALKFTRDREVAHIEVGCKNGDGEQVFFVKDNGAGFDIRYASKLFGVFQRLHRAEDYEGTGVGLAIVRRIIHRHGGQVWAEAEVDKGATFYFTLGDTTLD